MKRTGIERDSSSGIHRLLLAATAAIVLLAAPVLASAQSGAAGDPAATPASQTLRIYQAFRDQDFEALFRLLAFTEKGRASLTDAAQFAADMRAGYESGFKTPEEKADTDAILRSISDIMVGEPVIAGRSAAVPTSARLTVSGQTRIFRGVAHLIQDRGVWKLDLSIDEDSEKAMSQRVSEMIGTPDPPAS